MKVILLPQLIRRKKRQKEKKMGKNLPQPLVTLQVDVSCCKSARTRWAHSWREIPHQPG